MRMSLLFASLGLALAGSASAETWNTVSRGQNSVFMVDVDAIVVNGDITTIPLAAVPRIGQPTNYSHSIETYEFKCADAQWRTAGIVEYADDGAEASRIPEENGSWEATRPNTLPNFLKQLACDGVRAASPTWPSIKAFVEGGRVLPAHFGPSNN